MISVSHLTALDAAPEQYLAAAAAAGFEGVGMRVLPPRHAPGKYPVAGDPARCRALRAQADDLGIAIFEAESFPMEPDTDIENLLPGLEAGAILGASVLVSGGADTDEARMVDNYARLAEAAAPFGIRVAMEFMPSRPMKSLVDAVRVLDRVDNRNAALLIDVLHLFRSGGTVEDIGRLPREKIAYIHLCDAPAAHPGADGLTPESRARRLYPGEGELPLDALFALLPSDMDVSLEAPHRDQQQLPPEERIRRAGKQTLSFMQRIRSA
ncbi:MAG: sugar phosphate isomerase/epimerase family protein [Sedimentitalea sp.]|uniref:sugar phosphate isomerase/epimerase family protein n=1 Tax=Sedimentitalea sp. TaxID=2048915 RepID=UPI0032658B77